MMVVSVIWLYMNQCRDALDIGEKVYNLPYIGTVLGDFIVGNDADNVFQAGKGNDSVDGGRGSDTYIFERGDGRDTIDDFGDAIGDVDIVRFGIGISGSEIMLSRVGKHLVLSIAGTEDSVTIRNWTDGSSYRIERVEFADGTVWNEAFLAAKIAALPYVGTGGADSLYGDSGSNIFYGRKGDDTLDGGQGSDTYVFERGDGKDTIDDFGYATARRAAPVRPAARHAGD